MRNANLFAAIIGLAITPLATATTVGFSPAPTARQVRNSANANLTSAASLVLAGNFTSESFSFNSGLSISDNVTAIIGAGGWERFGVDTVTDSTNPGVTLPGLTINGSAKLANSLTDDNFGATKADYFNGKNLYLWIFNAATVAGATEMGIFKAAPWVFPTNGGGLNDTTIFGNTSPAVAVAAVNGIGSTSSSFLTLTGVTPVPEPSTFATGAMLVLAAMKVRRRRQG